MLSRRPFSTPIVAAILTTIAVASVIPAGAAITRTGTYLLVGSGGSGELHPDAAFDNKHNVYLAVWGDGGTGKDRPAWAQLVSAGGAMIGTKLRLTGCAAGVEVYGQKPAVTYTSGSTDNAFIVTYREWCGGKVTQYAQLLKYSSSGPVSIARTAIRSAGNPGGVAYNKTRKEAVAVWEEIGNNFDVWYRVIRMARDGNGVITGFAALPGAAAVTNAGKVQGLPRIAFDPNSSSYFIVFQGEDPSSSSYAMMAKTMDADNYALSPLLYVTKGGYPIEPAVVYLPSVTDFAVFWRNGVDIVGRRFTPVSGTATTSIYPVIARPGTDGAPGAAFDEGTGVGMVAGMNDDYYVWASEVNASGALVSTFRGSTAPTSAGTFFPRIGATGAGGFGMVYGLNYNKVYVERFSATGSGGEPPPPPPPPPTCTYALSTTAMTVSAFGGSGTINVVTNTTPCAWTATDNTAWLTVAGSGSSSGSASVTAQANPSYTSGRTGTATIAGKTVTFTQAKRRRQEMTDFDGDGKSDIAVFRPSGGYWYVRKSSNGATVSVQWGMSADKPAPGDYDGDGKTDYAVYRGGIWYIKYNSSGTTKAVKYGGAPSDIPMPADYDGDGKTDIAVYRKSLGNWYIIYSSTGSRVSFNWGGLADDWPVVGDYDGDGRADPTIFRRSSGGWYTFNLRTRATTNRAWRVDGTERPVPADFDGDGKTDLAFFHTATGGWWIYFSSTNSGGYYQYGNSPTNIPTPADYAGDGKTDLGIFAPGFYTRPLGASQGTVYNFGAPGDIPITK